MRQRQLMNARKAINWNWLGVFVSVIFTAVVHGVAGMAVIAAAAAGGQRAATPSEPGKISVSWTFYDGMREVSAAYDENAMSPQQAEALHVREDRLFRDEAVRLSGENVDRWPDEAQRLRHEVSTNGLRNLEPIGDLGSDLAGDGRMAGPAAMVASLLVAWWFFMLVCQGEGLELDLQRRRHPMWEWLFSHPVGAASVFLAEMLGPLVANPVYWSAPLFVGILHGYAAGPESGLVAAVLVGVPLTIAAACLGKALEIGAVLRLSVRSRGAVIGVLGWFGYASMLAMFFALSVAPRIVATAGPWFDQLARAPWPLAALVLGSWPDGVVSVGRAALFAWLASAVVIGAAVAFSARSVRHGLAGPPTADRLPGRRGHAGAFRRDPLVRKEYLWFLRDRSAIVQVILIPMSVGAVQLFNLRGVVRHAPEAWNYLCAAAVFFGTYFLWVLGPRSLSSEGPALWLALTWPRGLEGLLKAKARLWSSIASALVMIVLLVGCWLFPQQVWKIALVALGWFLFARSMAEKAVTLVTITSESGEAEKIPAGRRWAAQLGMLTFAIGVSTQQWHLAIVGIVYSWITAAAMWENLRARLPYLYDPWSRCCLIPPR